MAAVAMSATNPEARTIADAATEKERRRRAGRPADGE